MPPNVSVTLSVIVARAVIIGGRRVGRGRQSGVDRGERAVEGHRRVGRAVADGEGQAGERGQRQRAVGRRQRDIVDPGGIQRRVDIADRQARDGDVGRILGDGRGGGRGAGHRIVDRGDVDRLAVSVRLAGRGAGGAGIEAGCAAVVGGDLDPVAAVVIAGRRVGEAAGRRERRVDLVDRAGDVTVAVPLPATLPATTPPATPVDRFRVP